MSRVLAAVLFVLVASPAWADFQAKVGSFTKSTCTATCSQSVTGVGFTPKAVILVSNNETVLDTFANNMSLAIGFTDGTTSRAYAYSFDSSAATTRATSASATKLLNILGFGAAPVAAVAAAALTSFDSDGFTLSWTTNDANAYYIGYIALGGSSLSAKVIEWQARNSTGSKSLTGCGFAPTAFLTLGNGSTTIPPSGIVHGGMMFGMAAKASTVSNAWMTDGVVINGSFGLTQANRIEQTAVGDRLANFGGVVASFTSFDADGVTFNYTTAGAGLVYRDSLCLGGVDFVSGKFTHTNGAAPATQTITFSPSGSASLTWNPNTADAGPIMFFGYPGKFLIFGGTQQTADGTGVNGYFQMIGATDGAGKFSVAGAVNDGVASSTLGHHYVTVSNVYADSTYDAMPRNLLTTATMTSCVAFTNWLNGCRGWWMR